VRRFILSSVFRCNPVEVGAVSGCVKSDHIILGVQRYREVSIVTYAKVRLLFAWWGGM